MKFHYITFFLVIVALSQSCQSADEAYRLDYTDYVTGKPIVWALSATKVAEIQVGVPELALDSCLNHSPEQLYFAYEKKASAPYPGMDFGGEAGEDSFFQIFAMVVKKSNDENHRDLAQLRGSLRSAFFAVNAYFQQASGGGTLYYHMFERIPAYAEWALVQGTLENFNVQKAVSKEDLATKLREIVSTYSESEVTLPPPFDFSGISATPWILEKALEFAEEYR